MKIAVSRAVSKCLFGEFLLYLRLVGEKYIVLYKHIFFNLRHCKYYKQGKKMFEKTLQALFNHQSEFFCFFIFKVCPGSFVFDPFVGTGN